MEIIFNFLSQFFNSAQSLADYDYSRFIFWWKMIAAFFSTLFLFGIFYAAYQAEQIHKRVHAYIKAKDARGAPDQNKNKEDWEAILRRGASHDENERKFAVIAADSLIERILGLSGYAGENLGERLKKIEPSDLDSLNDLWEAHKIRNRIAHEADYKLSSEDSSRALSGFENALKELEYI